MTRRIATITILLGSGALVASFLPTGVAWPAITLVILTVIWVILRSQEQSWLSNLLLLANFILGAYGLHLGQESMLIFAGLFLSIAGWDLTDFSTRLRKGGSIKDSPDLIRKHYARLCLTLAVSIILALLATNLELKLPLGWMVVLALLAAFGLSRLFSALVKIE